MRSHSADFNIHDLDWFGTFDETNPNEDGPATYAKIDITEDNFEEEKLKKLYVQSNFDSSFIPADASYIKFSYYSEHDIPVIIEEENITIIQDGKDGEDAAAVMASPLSYQFLCDDSKIPFNDEVVINFIARQGEEKLKIKNIEVLPVEENLFQQGFISYSTSGIGGITPSVKLTVRSNGSVAPERIDIKFTVTCVDSKNEDVKRDVLFQSVCVATGVYLGAFHILDFGTSNNRLYNSDSGKVVLRKDWHSGDYFLKIGGNDNRYSPTIVEGVRYKWTGSAWIEDTSEDHLMSSFNDIISYAESLESNENTVKIFKSLTAALLQVGKVFANKITLMESGGKKGIIMSNNYNGTLNSDQTINTNAYGSQGWAIDYNGAADFVNMNATGGNFSSIKATGGEFSNIIVSGNSRIKGFLQQGVNVFSLWQVIFFYNEGLKISYSSLDQQFISIDKVSDGIFKVLIQDTYLNTVKFPEVWADETWSNVYLDAVVIQCSDKYKTVSAETSDNHTVDYLFTDPAYRLNCKIARPNTYLNSGLQTNNSLKYGMPIGYTDPYVAAARPTYSPLDLHLLSETNYNSWVHRNGYYEFYFIFTDFNTDGYIDPIAGASLIINMYTH